MTVEEGEPVTGLEEVMNTSSAIALLKTLRPNVRKEIFNQFCTDCGGDDPKCQCWNDE